MAHTPGPWRGKAPTWATVRKVLGHRTIVTTMRYAHLQTDALRRALDAICSGITIGPKAKRRRARPINRLILREERQAVGGRRLVMHDRLQDVSFSTTA